MEKSKSVLIDSDLLSSVRHLAIMKTNKLIYKEKDRNKAFFINMFHQEYCNYILTFETDINSLTNYEN